MKTTMILKISMLCMLAMLLASFTVMPGGDSFEVYINSKLIMKEYLREKRAVSAIQVDQNSNETLTIFFSHCGTTGTSRKITLKNDQNEIVKEWRFSDVDVHTKDPMTCAIKDINAFKKGNLSLSLYYSAAEREETLLAPIRWSDKITSRK